MVDAFPQSLYAVGPLIGEPSRLRMLWALLDGRAYTAGELATVAGISPAGASMHLAKLNEAGLLKVSSQGRHRYYHFGDEAVAHAVEALGAIEYKSGPEVSGGVVRRLPDARLRRARLCYGHLAGELGVAVWELMLKRGWILRRGDGYILGEPAHASLRKAALKPNTLTGRGLQVKPCMDWTERTYHLGGALGRQLLEHWVRRGSLHRTPRSRALVREPRTTAESLLELP